MTAEQVQPRQVRTNGAAIRVIRERSEMSINDVVKAIRDDPEAQAKGVKAHPDHLRNIELGNKDASEKLLGAIARALKCPKTAILRQPLDESVPA